MQYQLLRLASHPQKGRGSPTCVHVASVESVAHSICKVRQPTTRHAWPTGALVVCVAGARLGNAFSSDLRPLSVKRNERCRSVPPASSSTNPPATSRPTAASTDSSDSSPGPPGQAARTVPTKCRCDKPPPPSRMPTNPATRSDVKGFLLEMLDLPCVPAAVRPTAAAPLAASITTPPFPREMLTVLSPAPPLARHPRSVAHHYVAPRDQSQSCMPEGRPTWLVGRPSFCLSVVEPPLMEAPPANAGLLRQTRLVRQVVRA